MQTIKVPSLRSKPIRWFLILITAILVLISLRNIKVTIKEVTKVKKYIGSYTHGRYGYGGYGGSNRPKIIDSILDDGDVDLKQYQFLDWLNGEGDEDWGVGNKTSSPPFGGSLDIPGLQFDPLQAWFAVSRYAFAASQTPYDRSNIKELMRRLRTLYTFDLLQHERRPALQAIWGHNITSKMIHVPGYDLLLNSTVKELTKMIFPWISPWRSSIREMHSQFEGRGIVMSVGNRQFELALVAIIALRIVGCRLPIEIFYLGPDDLSPNYVNIFQGFQNVSVSDLYSIAGSEKPSGFNIKPFAIVASKFKEVLFVDADVLFLRDPDVVWSESQVYNKLGMMFFADRAANMHNQSSYFMEWLGGHPSNVGKRTRHLAGTTSHEMESGAVFVDKGRIGVLYGLLSACKLISEVEVEQTKKAVWGDKETFWLGMEICRVPWSLTPATGSYAGSIGKLDPEGRVCGLNLHVDENFRPFWWNGGVIEEKSASPSERKFINFENWAVDRVGVHDNWIAIGSLGCLSTSSDLAVLSGPLSREDKDLADGYKELFIELMDGGWKTKLNATAGSWMK
ncbi:hypothetical protein HDU76_012014 [Blyttiomyces sp. JEL0837]|nr:hypothetical protein HDU76_012014 [Blyttiomyces sp. JEL0837]